MSSTDAVGLLETQGLVAALHATDDMLKSSNVTLVGKEKIGAAYVTIIVRGDVAAVQTAIETGRQSVERLGGTLILADVIARPHPNWPHCCRRRDASGLDGHPFFLTIDGSDERRCISHVSLTHTARVRSRVDETRVSDTHQSDSSQSIGSDGPSQIPPSDKQSNIAGVLPPSGCSGSSSSFTASRSPTTPSFRAPMSGASCPVYCRSRS